MPDKLHLLGFASGLAGVDPQGAEGPFVLQTSASIPNTCEWTAMVRLSHEHDQWRIDEKVSRVCLELAHAVSTLVREHKLFSVIGGDHTAAIGTWSGAYDAMCEQGDIGLIWFDAHMDSHTPETTESGRLHGMPLACLLGYGYSTLTSVLHDCPKLKPANVCLIGVRSFERGEAELLKRLNVRVYFMDEVRSRGLTAVMQEAVAKVSENTVGYGLSIDLDGLDPLDAPGVDVQEPNGIKADDLFAALAKVAADPKLIGTEITEFNPGRDQQDKTKKIIINLLEIFSRAKRHANA